MEKLRARGDFTETSLTDEQKAEIADIRSLYKSKIAELEIHEATKMKQAATLEELENLERGLGQGETAPQSRDGRQGQRGS